MNIEDHDADLSIVSDHLSDNGTIFTIDASIAGMTVDTALDT